jgi:hypothetical protein
VIGAAREQAAVCVDALEAEQEQARQAHAEMAE